MLFHNLMFEYMQTSSPVYYFEIKKEKEKYSFISFLTK